MIDNNLKICPIILHAHLVNAQLHDNKHGYGYRLTDPHDDDHDTKAQCVGRRCMWFEWNDVCCWCGIIKD